MSDSVRPQRQQSTRLRHPRDSPGKNTGVGCHFLLQCMKVKVKSLSRVRLLATPWTAAHQAPLSMGFSRQEYWSGVPLPSPCAKLWPAKLLSLKDMALLIKDLVFIYQPYLERLKNCYIFVLLYICKVKLLIRAQLFATPWSAPSSSIHGIFKARVLEWVAISFFRESSQPRDRTQVSCIVDRRFTVWATREVLYIFDAYWFKLCLQKRKRCSFFPLQIS